MDEEVVLIFLGIFFALFILLIVIFLIILLKRGSQPAKPVQTPKDLKPDEPVLTLKQIVEVVANRKTPEKELTKAVLYFLSHFPFPKREREQIDPEVMVYLNFILLATSHKNANAKLIAHLSTEAKNKNPSYKIEIEKYEKLGMDQRNKSK